MKTFPLATEVSIWSDDEAVRFHGKDGARRMLNDFFRGSADEHFAQAGFAIRAEHDEGGVRRADMFQNGFTNVHALCDVLRD